MLGRAVNSICCQHETWRLEIRSAQRHGKARHLREFVLPAGGPGRRMRQHRSRAARERPAQRRLCPLQQQNPRMLACAHRQACNQQLLRSCRTRESAPQQLPKTQGRSERMQGQQRLLRSQLAVAQKWEHQQRARPCCSQRKRRLQLQRSAFLRASARRQRSKLHVHAQGN